jgi:hypothetical protein
VAAWWAAAATSGLTRLAAVPVGIDRDGELMWLLVLQGMGSEASDWTERLGKGAARRALPAV